MQKKLRNYLELYVLMTVTVDISALWNMTPCNSVGKYQHFELTCCLHFQGRNSFPLKSLLPIRFHGVAFQNAVILILTAVTTLDLNKDYCPLGCDSIQFGRLVPTFRRDLLSLKGSKQILPKRWCVSTKLYGVTSLKTTIFILTALRASGFLSFMISALSQYQPV